MPGLSFGLPPSSRLGLLRIDGVDPYAVRTAAEEVAATVREVIASAGPEVGPITLLGPAEAPLSRLKGRTRWQMLIARPVAKRCERSCAWPCAPSCPVPFACMPMWTPFSTL